MVTAAGILPPPAPAVDGEALLSPPENIFVRPQLVHAIQDAARSVMKSCSCGKTIASGAMLTAMLLGSLACGGASTQPSAGGGTGSASDQPRSGGTLAIGNAFQPFGLDHHQWVGGIGTTGPISPVHTQLVQYDPLDEPKIIGDLAEQWDVNADYTVYTFHLHKNVKFHNGSPLTSADVKATYQRLLTPQQGITISGGLRAGVQFVSAIDTPDDATIKLTMSRPWPSFLAVQAHTGYSIYPKALIDAKADFDQPQNVIGAGPFKFVDYTAGTSITLERNPNYFIEGRPYMDKVVNYIMNDDNTRLSAFRTGQTQFLYTFPGLLPNQIQILKNSVPNVVIPNPVAINTERLTINASRKPLDDVRVRRAINLALDRGAINDIARQGILVPGGAMIPSGKWGLTSEEVGKMPGWRQPKDQDLAEAKRLMAEAGYANGFKAVDLVRQGRLDEDMAQVLKSELAKIGIDMQLNVIEQSARTVLTNKGEWDFVNVTDSGEADDPDAQLGTRYYSKVVNAVNKFTAVSPDFDKLYEEQSITLDPAKRKELARQLQLMVLDYVPNVIMGWPTWAGAMWPQVRNFKAFTIVYNNLKLQDVWLGQ